MFLTVKKRTLIIGFLVVIAVVLCGVFAPKLAVADVFFGKSPRKVPVYGVDRPEKQIALSFDAAWGADKTQGIVDILQKFDAKATFFLVGFWVEKYPDLVKMLDKNGYELGNHSNNHLKMSSIDRDSTLREITTVNDGIKQLTGKTPKVFRAPFGDYNNQLIETVNELDMITIQWSIDSLDWKGINSMEIFNKVCSKAKGGDIVLFHNNSDHILEALPLILQKLKNEGFSFVTMSEQVYANNYIVDSNGIQHKKEKA